MGQKFKVWSTGGENGQPRQQQVAHPMRTEFIESGFVSYPRVGKHVAFEGDLLHGVCPALARVLLFLFPAGRIWRIWLTQGAVVPRVCPSMDKP